ncbi:MAG: hypothetical protein KIH03_09560 [Paludibacteraceae bacterium]|nr:hypothetical protein [Paludibacteraceae bacterium]
MKYIATIICTAVGLLALITYVHMLMPTEKQLDNKFIFEQKVNNVTMTFSYINKQTKEVSMSPRYIQRNLIIPAEITHHNTRYRIVEFSKEYSLDCDTLFIPESIKNIDDRVMNWDRCKINYISVDPNNKIFNSKDGNLYKGDSLIYEAKANIKEDYNDEK